MSPKKDAPKSVKKSLWRIVLEANAIAASKQNLEEQLEPSEPSKTIESTPMKNLKPVSSLVDVTISPIICKSILQSSDESILAQSASQEPKSANDTQDIKSIPAFTLNETKFSKSVLHSYESSTAEIPHDESKTKFEITTSKVEFKSVPAFTLGESYFEKSVLHSYESSVADASSIQEEKLEGKVIALKPSTASTSLNITDFDKSVLASHDTTEDKSSHKNVSNLIRSDSEKEEWKDKKENQNVIQKEKEKIVEIEREINEIENYISEEEDSENKGMEIDTSADSSAEDEEDDEKEESENENETSSSASIILVGDSDDSHESLPERKEKSKSPVILKRDSNITTEKIKSVEKGIETKKIGTIESIQVTKNNSNAMTDKIETVESGTAVKTVDSNVATEKIFVESIQISTDAEKIESVESSADPLNQAHIFLMIDDNSVHSDRSDMELNYSDEKAEVGDKAEENKVDAAEKIETKSDQIPEKISAKETPVTGKQIVEPIETEEEKSVAVDAEIITEKIHPADKITISVSSAKEDIETKGDISESKNKEVVSKDSIAKIHTAEEEEAPKKPITRSKRARSTNSTSSTKEAKSTEPKTPITRKRTQSATSNKSATEELKTPEDSKPEATTPSRRRAKTPNTEVRKIITRRTSKELSEKLDDSLREEVLTPRRRSTCSRTKNIDDNASIASGSSVRSTRSKQSEDVGEVKPVRKGRKSVLSTKPDLSVIPESVEESSKAKDIVAEYSSSRRLTRHQKTVLESWLESTPVSTRRRTSTTSRASAVSEHSHDDDDASSTHSAFDVQPIDRISLLNKGDFEGSPDPSELQGNVSPESIASDAGKMWRPRMVRASSESRTTTPKAKAIRRISVDISETPARGSPAPASPSRGRCASFTKACEALTNTPKGRRISTDVRKGGDTDSATSSPPPPSEADAATTPARRPRRASAPSAASTSKDTAIPKWPRKLSAIEESKGTKKK